MKIQVFTDKKGKELTVKHRKSAIFFEGKANVDKPNGYGERHKELICITELRQSFEFSSEEFQRFIDYCVAIPTECWSNFEAKEADSLRADYDDYYDREFDNNGSLSVYKNLLNAEAPYTQLKSNGEVIRFIKFNKRTFESFVYDLKKLAHT